MKIERVQTSNTWDNMSYRKYNSKNRNNWYEKDFDLYDVDVISYGIYEDLTLYCGCGVEDWWEIVEEFN